MAKNGRSFALSLHTHPSAVGLGHAFEREEEPNSSPREFGPRGLVLASVLGAEA